jgi:hypothetical protein
MSAVSINVTAQGAQPTPPAVLRANLLNLVASQRPGYTASLPGSLIEDISSTDVGALALIDQATIDLLNSLTTNQANEYLVPLQGAQMGIPQGVQSNSSAYVQFTGIAGYVIQKGFVVSDGLNQYTVQDGGILESASPCSFTGAIAATTLTVTGITGQIMIGDTITGAGVTANTVITGFGTGTGGNGTYTVNNTQTVSAKAMTGMTHGTTSLYVVANQYGTWAIPSGSISTIVTSVPTGYPLTCTNVSGGIIATTAESIDLYRARVAQAQLAPAVGSLSYLKTQIAKVTGVQSRLISVSGTNKIIVGGGDPYAVANAIFKGQFDVANLQGSLNHSHVWSATGSIMGAVLTITAVASGTIAVGDIVSGSGLAVPTVIMLGGTGSGGTGTYLLNYSQSIPSESITGAASNQNVITSIIDYPDSYTILYVSPIAQSVSIALNWSTVAPNFTANSTVAASAGAALVSYINAVQVTTALNVYKLQQAFMDSLVTIIEPTLISNLTFTVSIDGVVTAPTSGTGLIPGNAEGFFITDISKIAITRV